jgi:O-antigen ligase
LQMAAAALRAWKTAPWFGIGPGMHQNLWPHFAATPDGDRATRRWPTHPNFAYHSYEVHSDWVQLLEEYGAAGFALFLLAAAACFGLLARDLRGQSRQLLENRWRCRGDEPHPFVLSALLAMVCMGFHSLGDFNLQIPATTWLLAAVLGIAGAHLGEAGAR